MLLFYLEHVKSIVELTYSEKDKYDVDPGPFLVPFQKHENEEDGASGNKDGNGREKETDVAISFVFGQNIKDRAKVSCFPRPDLFLTHKM